MAETPEDKTEQEKQEVNERPNNAPTKNEEWPPFPIR